MLDTVSLLLLSMLLLMGLFVVFVELLSEEIAFATLDKREDRLDWEIEEETGSASAKVVSAF